MLASHFQIGVDALLANRLRSLLAMVGIIVGVASVITMISLGQGARLSVATQIQALGTNLLSIVPGGADRLGVGPGSDVTQTLTWADARAIAGQVEDVDAVTAEYARTAQVTAHAQYAQINVSGTTPAFLEVRNFAVSDGVFFTDTEVRLRARVAVLGRTAVERLFGDRDAVPLGARIRINRVPFTVIGILAEKGLIGVVDWDDIVFVPLSTAQRLFGVDHVRAVYARVATPHGMAAAVGEAEQVLRVRHRLRPNQENDFTIRNQEDLVALFHGITRTMTLLLAGIAAISLFVGGVGIMNIMLSSVTERTREIGLRKAVGARRRDIVGQFLMEAVMLSLIGGATGAAAGIVSALVISRLSGWAMLLPGWVVLLALSFAAGVGICFGLYPAVRAARLDPVVALRYE